MPAILLAVALDLALYETPGATTEGDVTIPAEPEAAYSAAIDYAGWTNLFPDLRKVSITSHTGDDARVTFVHKDGEIDNLHFRAQPARHSLWFEQTNGDAEVWGEICFLPGDKAGTTRVHAKLHADVRGWKSMFAGDVQSQRREQVRRDLAQFFAYFTR
jgi:hypothetical protein